MRQFSAELARCGRLARATCDVEQLPSLATEPDCALVIVNGRVEFITTAAFQFQVN